MRTALIKEQTQALWQAVFGDPQAFLDIYFSFLYRPAYNVYHVAQGQVVSALQILPRTIYWSGDHELPIGYVSGLATLPSYRGQGHAKALMQQAHQRMYARGDVMSLLIPAQPSLFAYYHRYNYATCAYRVRTLCVPSLPQSTLSSSVQLFSRLLSSDAVLLSLLTTYIHHIQRFRPSTVQHDYQALQAALQDLALVHAPVAWAVADGTVLGVILARRITSGLEIIFEFAQTPDLLSHLRTALRVHLSSGDSLSLSLATPYDTPPATPYAQARILDLHRLLIFWAKAHPTLSAIYTVIDPELPHNTGTYTLHAGLCRHTAPIVGPPTHTLQSLAAQLWSTHGCLPTLMLD